MSAYVLQPSSNQAPAPSNLRASGIAEISIDTILNFHSGGYYYVAFTAGSLKVPILVVFACARGRCLSCLKGHSTVMADDMEPEVYMNKQCLQCCLLRFLYSPTAIPNAMRGGFFSGGSVALVGYNVEKLWGHSSDRVWKLATTQVGLAVLALVAILVVRYVRSPWRQVPLGPRGLPIIGNAFEMRDKSWLLERECKQKYSALSFSTDMTSVLMIPY